MEIYLKFLVVNRIMYKMFPGGHNLTNGWYETSYAKWLYLVPEKVRYKVTWQKGKMARSHWHKQTVTQSRKLSDF